jgi:DedD protein
VKERITGAIILVAVLVLLIPELLTGPSRSVHTAQATNAEGAQTAADGAQMRSYTIDLADDGTQRSAVPPVAELPTPDAKAADGSANGAGAQSGSNVDDGAKAADSGDASGTAVREAGETSESARNPAPDAREELPKPAPRAEASPTGRASESSARGGSTDSKPTSSKVTSGWAVQVGSFASRDNAERLAQKLKGKGFAATISQSPKGRRLWRVRVGPEADRAAATALGAKLRSAGQPGAVVPYP